VYASLKDETDSYYGFDVQFDRPVCLVRNTEYKLGSFIKGPASWYGEKGQETLDCIRAQFTFRDGSPYCRSNGTGVEKGQFAAFLIS